MIQERISPRSSLTLRPPFALIFAGALALAGAESSARPMVSETADPVLPGADVFVTVREGLLREKPTLSARVVAKLSAGTRLKLLDAGERFIQAESVAVGNEPEGAVTGYIAREITAVFAPGAEGTRGLVVVGRTFASNDSHRRLAAAFLLRAAERLRDAGTPDPRVEVLPGETAESLAAAGGPFPPGLTVSESTDLVTRTPRFVYTGDAFRRALDLTTSSNGEDSAVRERALAGSIRLRYPGTAASLAALWEETAGWLQLVESARDPSVVRGASGRLGTASLALGRNLLAAGKPLEMERIRDRARAAGERVAAMTSTEREGKKLLSRIEIIQAMRGNGGPAFPQEARVRVGAIERSVRIDGKLGALALTVQSGDGKSFEAPRRRVAVPILPVPGSFRVSSDGRSAAWVEVIGPSTLVPVMTSLEKDEPAREVAFLASGQPLRDRFVSHVIGSVTGFSRDGQRLGLSIQAWDETPGPEPRLSVVSVATGELLFETSKDLRGFERLLR